MKKIFWLTGLPCSGKTTIANELSKHINAEILDGDDIRKISNNQDFSPGGREKHMLSVAELAYRFSKYTNVIVALVSPLKAVREKIKETYPNVIEIYIKCDIEECKRRDIKGMYAKALKGEIKNFTGIGAPYEEPNVMRNKDHTHTTFVDTETFDVKQCVDVILERHYEFKKYALFIGRWQCPGGPHDGHKALFDVVRKEGKNLLIGIRDTEIDEKNPYSVQERIDMIEKSVPDARIVILPDIESVNYGRGVGYEIREIKLDKKLEEVSATRIREKKK